jgi:SAM-dependent methyltransferase
MSKATDQVRKDWARLGDSDPLWAVLVRPGKKNGGWDERQFLDTGREEVEESLAHLAVLGVRLETGSAIDFGCGAGRLTIALAERVDRVVGIDVSAGMLAKARALDTTGGRCTFVLNPRDDLSMFDDGSFDLAYSSLVLQHLPPALARATLGELARVTRPGGALIVQVPTATLPNVKGMLFKHAPIPVLRFGQRVMLRYPAPMRMHAVPEAEMVAALEAAGMDVLDRVPDQGHGGHWTYHRYFAVKRV